MGKASKTSGDQTREKILDTIIVYVEKHGYAPTIREICHDTGIKSTSTVQGHLNIMFSHGVLETDAGIGSPRAIRVPGYKFIKK